MTGTITRRGKKSWRIKFDHSKASITLDVYGHLFKDDGR